jgi:hypothetical protein
VGTGQGRPVVVRHVSFGNSLVTREIGAVEQPRRSRAGLSP